MKRRTLALLLLPALCLSATLPLVQERVSKKGPPEFAEVHAEVARAFNAGKFGTAMNKAKELLSVVQTAWTKEILAALPAAPEGFEIVPQKKQNAQAAGFAAAMSGAMGTVIEQSYKSGGKRITATIQADSPLIQMFSMWVANPAMLGDDAELIKYKEHNAVLKKQGRGFSLQILIGSSLVEAKGDATDDQLLKMFDQTAVDKLAAVLAI